MMLPSELGGISDPNILTSPSTPLGECNTYVSLGKEIGDVQQHTLNASAAPLSLVCLERVEAGEKMTFLEDATCPHHQTPNR